MNELISANRNALIEALDLSREIIKNIELDEISLSNIALKTCRLSRLLNDFEMQRVFQLEVSGYDYFPNGLPFDLWQIAGISKRHFQVKDSKTKKINEYMFRESIAELEATTKVVSLSLEAAKDPDVSITSANPNQFVMPSFGNVAERNDLRQSLSTNLKRLASRKALIYDYVIRRHYELKFSGLAEDIFTRVRENVDNRIGQFLPESIKKFTAVYDNLRSENPEDWSNAVHGCRRILQDLADAVYPAKDEPIKKEIKGKIQEIKIGKDNYINRIIAFVEEQNNSERFNEIVGSHLSYLGMRLDSIFQATQKGSHSLIVSRTEADRYVIFTYILIGDILSLKPIIQVIDKGTETEIGNNLSLSELSLTQNK